MDIITTPRASLVEIIRGLSVPMDPLHSGVFKDLHPLSGIRNVVFDLYGTLFISGSGDIGISREIKKDHAMEEALRACGVTLVGSGWENEGLALFHGCIAAEHQRLRELRVDVPEVRIDEIWARSIPRLVEAGFIEAPARIAVDRLAVEFECRANPVWLMPGMTAMLHRLHQQGLRLGIVSNAQFFTPLLFEALAGESAEELGFDPAICAWSYELRAAKPSPRVFEPLLDQLDPRETVYVGNDMLNDVFAASQAGMHTVWFAGDARSKRARETDDRCRTLKPGATITKLSELENVLCPASFT